MDAASPVVELRGITRRFPGVVACRDVDLAVLPGEIHAIVGENGAGKSTLVRILYGMQRPDAGRIFVNGREVRPRSPADAIRLGIGMVQQHVQLADNLSVVENVIIGAEPVRRGRLDLGRARDEVRRIAALYGLPLDPAARAGTLPVGERQRVEILKVLYRGSRILVLDEPTAVLVPREVDELLAGLRRLASEGMTILFISHKLDEVLAVADRITVMRAGAIVAVVRPGEVTPGDLARLMVGEMPPSPADGRPMPSAEVALAVEGVSCRHPGGAEHLDHATIRVRRGEVVGIAGVEGNGQGLLAEAILGLARPASGTIRLGGLDVTRRGAGERRRLGLACIPADRHQEGLLLDAPVWENRMLGHQRAAPSSRGPWLTPGAARADTRRMIADSDLRTPSVEVAASALSGGNQQRLIVARELRGAPRVLLAIHPTRGVDVRAQAEIWERLRRARDGGLAVVLISADLPELLALADRVAVLLRGRLVAEYPAGSATVDALGVAMTGAGPT